MGDYQIGGGLQLLTAVQKTEAFAEFLKERMVHALGTALPPGTSRRLSLVSLAVL